MVYNYEEAMKEDIRDYLSFELRPEDLEKGFNELYDDLYDDMWVSDSITGNASGSYTFNRCKAEENVKDNLSLLASACVEFGETFEDLGKMFINEKYEQMDVIIRCFLLSEVLSEVLSDFLNA